MGMLSAWEGVPSHCAGGAPDCAGNSFCSTLLLVLVPAALVLVPAALVLVPAALLLLWRLYPLHCTIC